MNDPRIRLTFDGPVATITLARPEKLNALDMAMIAALHRAALDIEAQHDVRCALLTGEGKVFCAGGDIAAWSGQPPIEMWRTWTHAGHRAFDALARLRVPLIAVLAGHAFGGGLELAATADFLIAERHVLLSLPETGLGMIPGWSGTQRIVRRFGSRAVKRMALAGASLAAGDAMAFGLIDGLAETGGGMASAIAMAQRIAARGPLAVQIAKQLINVAEGEEGFEASEMLAGSLAAYTQDLSEGVTAFAAKRPPAFKNT